MTRRRACSREDWAPLPVGPLLPGTPHQGPHSSPSQPPWHHLAWPGPVTSPQHCPLNCPLISAPATLVLTHSSGKWATLAHSSSLWRSWAFTWHVLCLTPLPESQSFTFTLCTRSLRIRFKCHFFLREAFPDSTRLPVPLSTHWPSLLLVLCTVCHYLFVRFFSLISIFVHKSVNSIKIKTMSTCRILHFSGHEWSIWHTVVAQNYLMNEWMTSDSRAPGLLQGEQCHLLALAHSWASPITSQHWPQKGLAGFPKN